MKTNAPSNRPFEKIALALSGGGYRATAFHLGAMSYLNKLKYNGRPLLENIEMISSVSGGTITGIVYALKKGEGKEFAEIYDFLLQRLQTLDLLKDGIAKLSPDGKWKNSFKRKNIINAFAELYDEYLTEGATLSDLNRGNSHLNYVVFNSTEFTHALDFRFRNKNGGYCGNYYSRLDLDTSNEIKLSDVMAASSCFPAGFEPIIWPSDFVHDQSPKIKAYKEQNNVEVGLMDGGIYDNQGLGSILNYKKNQKPSYFDLIIVSDVTSPYMDAFMPSKDLKKKWSNKWTISEVMSKSKKFSNKINWILFFAITIVLLLPLFSGYENNIWTGISLMLALGLGLILLIKVIVVNKIKIFITLVLNRLLGNIPEFYRDKLSKLKIEELTLHRVNPLFLDRINSLYVLMLNVFLKVVRRLNYKILYDNDTYKYRRISNLIKELSEEDFNIKRINQRANGNSTTKANQNSILNGDYTKVVGDKIPKIVTEASSFGTTLWFTDKDKLSSTLEKLLITGQVTMCFNLLEYLENIINEQNSGFGDLNEGVKKNVRETYELCKKDWDLFKDKPERMLGGIWT